jgi:hypothetical protein
MQIISAIFQGVMITVGNGKIAAIRSKKKAGPRVTLPAGFVSWINKKLGKGEGRREDDF